MQRRMKVSLAALTFLLCGQGMAKAGDLYAPRCADAMRAASGGGEIKLCSLSAEGAPQAPAPTDGQICLQDPCGACCCENDLWRINGDPRWSLWAWGAGTYVSGPANGFGVGEGLYGGYRLTEVFGLYGGFGFNHASDNTQFLGTLGVQRFGDPEGESLLDRTSFWMLWDQYTTGQANSYINQLRFNAGYVTSEATEIGMTFSVPLSDQNGGAALPPIGGAGMMSLGQSYVGPYVSTDVSGMRVYGTVGYSEATKDAAFGAGIAAPVNERSNVILDAKYGGDDSWALSLGYAIGFGARDTWRK